MVDLPNEDEIVAMFVHRPGARLLLATDMGDGFIAAQDEVLAQTRAGRQVLNVKAPARAILCRPAPEGADAIAVIGANRKMLVFPIDQCPQLTRGKGLRLQRYKDGGLSDALAFTLADGLKWSDGGGRTRHQADLTDWLGDRASAGRMAPRGFPRDNRFP
jgi:topoisomerase-4 subunit A